MEIMQDASEIVHYEQAGVPLYVRASRLSAYPDMRALCHWHDDVEFIHILEGEMNYYINGKRVLLGTNDCLMVNARQMHYGYSSHGKECRFSCILFHPELFTGNQVICRSYVRPILENRSLPYLFFDSGEDFGRQAAAMLERIVCLKERGEPAYEMEAVGMMHILWSGLARHARMLPQDTADSCADLDIQKDMVSYIYLHYAEKISLSDIAASGHVCRNKCCLIFKRCLQQSPIEFLNSCRLKASGRLLMETEESITAVALSCGFSHLSYFSKLFLRSYGCTPGEYRKKNVPVGNGRPDPPDG